MAATPSPDCVLAQPSGAITSRSETAPTVDAEPESPEFGQPVISSEDCIGPVVAGVCRGVPKADALTAACCGQMLNGICTGPMF